MNTDEKLHAIALRLTEYFSPDAPVDIPALLFVAGLQVFGLNIEVSDGVFQPVLHRAEVRTDLILADDGVIDADDALLGQLLRLDGHERGALRIRQRRIDRLGGVAPRLRSRRGHRCPVGGDVENSHSSNYNDEILCRVING